MGIRYDKDNRRATNGPLIFFSLIRDENFEEEINSAFLSGLSFYAYRFPHDNMMSYGSSESFLEGLGETGFVIGLFDPKLPYITIPYRGTKQKENLERRYVMPENSTSEKEYCNEVEQIVNDLKAGKGEKVVAARVLVKDQQLNIADCFYDLCQRFPEAFVFCFSTPSTGCWIGASPELLLENKDTQMFTMALAGTRPAGVKEAWDEKNMEEQEIVTEFISSTFQRLGYRSFIGESFTKPAGSIEHICTPVSLDMTMYPEFSQEDLEKLLRTLSPTPALCGSPKEFALEEIEKLEKFQRGCYGGFCGPFHSPGDFTFNVVLRCASVSEKKYCIYAGGGITSKSLPYKEWHETEIKIKTVFP